MQRKGIEGKRDRVEVKEKTGKVEKRQSFPVFPEMIASSNLLSVTLTVV